jgi:hypothetical protein
MEEIAQKAAVSLTTVSRVMHQPEKVGPGILDRAIPCIRARDIPEGEENYVDFDIMVINRGIR